MLPFPTYSCFFPGGLCDNAKFMHFIGKDRFDEDSYARHVLSAIAELVEFPEELPVWVRRCPSHTAR